MIEAPVGFQCPDCVREGSKGVRQARTVFGAPVGAGSYVTYAVIGISAVMFLLQQVPDAGVTSALWLIGGNNPVLYGVATGEYYRLLTAAFLHGGLLHLLLNMFLLYVLGQSLEPLLGHLRFAGLYLLSALGGSAVSYAFLEGASLGASGAVFGLLGASLVVGRRLRQDTAGLWILLAINVAYGFYRDNIDWRAHFGGLVVGAAVAAVLAYAPRKLWVQAGGFLVVLLLVLTVVFVRTAALRSGVPEATGIVFPTVDICCGGTTPV